VANTSVRVIGNILKQRDPIAARLLADFPRRDNYAKAPADEDEPELEDASVSAPRYKNP
jgi:hypothetical protein